MASRTGSHADQFRASVCNRKCRIRQPRLTRRTGRIFIEIVTASRSRLGEEAGFFASMKNLHFVPIRKFYMLCFQRLESAGLVFCVPIRIFLLRFHATCNLLCSLRTFGVVLLLPRFRTKSAAFRVLSHFFSRIWMVARVTSQSKFIEQPSPALTSEIVKSSSGASSFCTCMVVRARSNCSPG